MNVLGIGGYSHDSAAALVCDGELVAAVAEERLTRVKHQGGIPVNAVQYCLDRAGLTPGDIDHIGGYMQPLQRMARRMAYRAKTLPRTPIYAAAYMGYEVVHNARYVRGLRGLRGPRTRLHFMDHHPAHCASAFLVSPHERAALLSIDYIGEWTATWLGVGEGVTMERAAHVDYPHSLGTFYSAVTDYLGFQRASDEYKVMGLAPYGEPEYLDAFREIVHPRENGLYAMDLSWMQYHVRPGSRVGYFSDRFVRRFGPPRKKDDPVEDRHKNLAASAQQVLEETVLRLVQRLHDTTQAEALCFAGGVALNCAMNGRLKREAPFKNIFVQPAAGDDGIAIGAAFQLYHQFSGKPRAYVMESAALGPDYTTDQVRAALVTSNVAFEEPDDLETRAAELLAGGRIVGWFQGRAEFGPRALGSRSILADPTRPGMKDRLNATVKYREEFRPFAPACPEERVGEFFEGGAKSPFMLFTYPVRAEWRERLPAITHVDGTARVQTVDRDVLPRFHCLLEAFEALRGVPVVLNTSFNVMGEPIVTSPEDALRCFHACGLDALVIDRFVVLKPSATRPETA